MSVTEKLSSSDFASVTETSSETGTSSEITERSRISGVCVFTETDVVAVFFCSILMRTKPTQQTTASIPMQ